ncbi:MAG TPA: aspartate aminotransferase family protein [Longimicrobiales bacterium]|nr:aspartate aminotransferase family protein [Longimicrobiales bacterium]
MAGQRVAGAPAVSGSVRLGALLPDVTVPPPGPASRSLAERLSAVESRNVTHVGEDWPVFWEEAVGANVRDADGNVYVDLTGGFGVALLGHSHPRVSAALVDQAYRLVHGMGDVHPPALKVSLLERLAELAPWRETRGVLASTGSEAVEIALKTAHLATRRPGVLAFEGGYHGLTLGSLAVTSRPHFRAPFERRLYRGVAFAPFPDARAAAAGRSERSSEAVLARVREILREGAPNGDPIGAVIVEPIQGRAGVRMAPEGFMTELSGLASEAGALVVADEMLTGMGRCGSMFASERVGLVPDLLCIGKALGAGLPLSACLGARAVMDAWPTSTGEAVHTSTFLGHPLACAAALAALDSYAPEQVLARVDRVGRRLRTKLEERLSGARGVARVGGLGLLVGIELGHAGSGAAGMAARVASACLKDGLLALPAGEVGEVLELTPPVVLTDDQADHAIEVLVGAIERIL